MRKRALSIRIMFGSKCECVSIAIHFAVGRIGLRVHVLREEQRAMPAYEEPPVYRGVPFWLGKPPAMPVEVPRKKALASSIERSELLAKALTD